MAEKVRTPTRRAVIIGVIAGVVGIYLAATGNILRFHTRNVLTTADGEGILQLSYTFLLLVILAAAYRAARGTSEQQPDPARRIGLGVLTGGVAGAVVALFVAAMKALIEGGLIVTEITPEIRAVLLDDILLFGRGLGAGSALLIGLGAALGAVAASVHLLDRNNRRPLMVGFVATLLVSLMEPLLRVIIEGLGVDTAWLYQSRGLTVTGAIIVFVVVAGLLTAWTRRGDLVRERVRQLPTQQRSVLRWSTIALFILFLLFLPSLAGLRVSEVLTTIGIYVLLGLGLNIVVGYAGLLDLGYVAFFAVGAYVTAILTFRSSFLVSESGVSVAQLDLGDKGFTNFWVALPIVVILAVIIGVLIGAPVLRLRGDYLAIVTLGFGEIIRVLVASDWLRPWLGGAQGIIAPDDIPPATLELRKPANLYFLILAAVLLAAFISYRLVDSRVGRAWAAMREDESVAEAMGISVIKYKLLAFAIGAGIASLGGAFFAVKIGSVFPNSFKLIVSINVLAVIILGGMGSIPGVIVGSIVLVGLPELLREFAEYRLLFYGAILVAIMIYKPEGLVPNKRRVRELHEVDEEEAQFAKRAGEDTAAPVVTAGGSDEK
ncbi:MAG TPA: leucine/isoleucine/valine transporter permease subunit [Actinomycetota bacterium]|nr:leucine/isoleucine/valine transporter permease subunit [Actinomycetota bacterium]